MPERERPGGWTWLLDRMLKDPGVNRILVGMVLALILALVIVLKFG